MSLLAAISAAVTAAAAAGSTVTGAARGTVKKQKKIMDMQYEYQRRAAEEAYQRQLDFFNRQNEYNEKVTDPAYTKARLEAAGMLGASQFAGSTPGAPTASMGAPQGTSGHVDIPTLEQLAPGMGVGQNLANMMEQISRIQNIDADTELKGELSLTQTIDRQLKDSQIMLNQAGVMNTEAKTAYQILQNNILEATKGNVIQMSDIQVKQSLTSLSILGEQLKANMNENSIFDIRRDQAIAEFNRTCATTMCTLFDSFFEGLRTSSGIALNNAEIQHLHALVGEIASRIDINEEVVYGMKRENMKEDIKTYGFSPQLVQKMLPEGMYIEDFENSEFYRTLCAVIEEAKAHEKYGPIAIEFGAKGQERSYHWQPVTNILGAFGVAAQMYGAYAIGTSALSRVPSGSRNPVGFRK